MHHSLIQLKDTTVSQELDANLYLLQLNINFFITCSYLYLILKIVNVQFNSYLNL